VLEGADQPLRRQTIANQEAMASRSLHRGRSVEPTPDALRAIIPAMPERTLTTGHLNRALLARQLLLERLDRPIPAAISLVGGLQTQYAPSGYVGLWTRIAGFRREALTAALEDRSVVQATLMRTTIHVVPAEEFWRYAAGVRSSRRIWALRAWRDLDEATMVRRADDLRAALADGPRSVKELGDLGAGFVGNLGLWVDLVRVPPSGTWERRRADRLALADAWLGPDDASEVEGLAHLVRAYLRAFGPAPWKDVASWAGVSVADLKRGAAELTLVRHRDVDGRELLDLPDAPLPDPDAPAPVRFLPHWDASLLVHARRTGVLPEAHRPKVFTSRNPFSVGTVLADGRVVAAWSVKDGRVVVDPYESVDRRAADAIEDERAALEAFHG
jgi:hypothetical protein